MSYCNNEDPLYIHDCDKCRFLGRYRCTHSKSSDEGLHNYDLYVCGDNVVARYGNDGPEYTSGMEFVGTINPLTEAKRRAEAFGVDFEQIRRDNRDERIKGAYQRLKCHRDVFEIHHHLTRILVLSSFHEEKTITDYIGDLGMLMEMDGWTEMQVEAAKIFVLTMISEEAMKE